MTCLSVSELWLFQTANPASVGKCPSGSSATSVRTPGSVRSRHDNRSDPRHLSQLTIHVLVLGIQKWRKITVWSRYNMVNLLQNTHNRHSIACPWGQAMGVYCDVLSSPARQRYGCLFWIYSVTYILPSWLSLLIKAEWHICVNKITIIGSDNGLAPCQHQAIIWTNTGILLI